MILPSLLPMFWVISCAYSRHMEKMYVELTRMKVGLGGRFPRKESCTTLVNFVCSTLNILYYRELGHKASAIVSPSVTGIIASLFLD